MMSFNGNVGRAMYCACLLLMKSDDQVKFQAIRACSGPAQALPFPKSWLCAYATVPGIEMRILEPTKIYAEGFGAK